LKSKISESRNRHYVVVLIAWRLFLSKEDLEMIRMMFAAAIAALAFTAVSGVAQAAPIAPLPAATASDAATGNLTQVYYHHHCRWHHGHRHCW
jgi:hypothetical protein